MMRVNYDQRENGDETRIFCGGSRVGHARCRGSRPPRRWYITVSGAIQEIRFTGLASTFSLLVSSARLPILKLEQRK